MTLRKIAAAVLLACLTLIGVANGADEEYIKYDFTKPEEVFKATTKESVVGQGLDAAVLHQTLQAGQFVIVNDKTGNPKIPWLTTEGIFIAAPPDKVFSVISDVSKYDQFMPQMDSASAKSVTPNIDHIFYNLAIQILFIKVKIPYSVYHWNQPPKRVDWVMAGGEFNENLGAYEVVPVPADPNGSMLFYTSYSLPRNKTVVDLFNKIPNLDMMINLSAGTLVIEAMMKRAETVHLGKEPPKKAATAAFPDLIEKNTDTLAKLASRGKMVMIENVNPVYYTGAIIVNKPRDQVFDAIADFEGMSTVSKQVTNKVLKREGDKVEVKVRTVINLVVDFDSTYEIVFTLKRPDRIDFVGKPGGDVEGVAGSWIFKELSENRTLVFYRNTSDLKSTGVAMKTIINTEPSFEMAIQASQTILVLGDAKKWAESRPAK